MNIRFFELVDMTTGQSVYATTLMSDALREIKIRALNNYMVFQDGKPVFIK